MSKAKRRGGIIKYCTIVLLVVFLISAALFALELWQRKSDSGLPTNEFYDDYLEYDGKKYVQNNNIETFLVLGLDKFEGAEADSYNNDKCADFLMLLVLDNKARKCTAVHINRDTVTDINILGVDGSKIGRVSKQIALAHTYGNGKDVSCRNTADAVSNLLYDMRVNHYMSLTMDAVAVLTDLVGGVEVTVPDDLTVIDENFKKGETVTLSGESALGYIRARYGLEDSSNLARMKRQKDYVNALFDKVSYCANQDEAFIVDASLKLSDYMVSDRSVTQLQEVMRKFREYEFSGIIDIEGESKKGEEYMEFYPSSESLLKIVIDLFYIPES